MYCPKCATQNVDGASFCRSCGANISLIPHALSGSLPQTQSTPNDRSSREIRRRLRREREVEPSIERGILNIFIGLGFIVAAIAVMTRFPAGIFWGWSFFIPGFSTLGRGVASLVAARRAAENQSRLATGVQSGYFPNAAVNPSAPVNVGTSAPQTGQLMTPVPSVTEGTTRHLGSEAHTRHFDPNSPEENSR
jgi:zinc-ribbon domain